MRCEAVMLAWFYLTREGSNPASAIGEAICEPKAQGECFNNSHSGERLRFEGES